MIDDVIAALNFLNAAAKQLKGNPYFFVVRWSMRARIGLYKMLLGRSPLK